MNTAESTNNKPSHYYFVACNLHHAKTCRIFIHRLEQAFKGCYCKYRDDNIISYDVFTPLDRDCIIILLKHLSEELYFTDRDTLIVYFPEEHVENNSLVETDRERHVIIGHLQVMEADRLCRKIEQFIRSYGVDRFFDRLKDEKPE